MKIGHIMIPCADIEASLSFYTDVLGLTLRFRDGDRYAALDGAGTTLALVAPSEQPVPGQVAIGLRVDDVETEKLRISAAGGDVGPLTSSEHEDRRTVTAPEGTTFVLYAPR